MLRAYSYWIQTNVFLIMSVLLMPLIQKFNPLIGRLSLPT